MLCCQYLALFALPICTFAEPPKDAVSTHCLLCPHNLHAFKFLNQKIHYQLAWLLTPFLAGMATNQAVIRKLFSLLQSLFNLGKQILLCFGPKLKWFPCLLHYGTVPYLNALLQLFLNGSTLTSNIFNEQLSVWKETTALRADWVAK